MVFCRGCGKEIHEEAPSCPHCGAVQGRSALSNKDAAIKPNGGKGWFWVVAIIVVIIVLWVAIPAYNDYQQRVERAQITSGQPNKFSALASETPSQILPTGELAAMFNLMSSNTDLQRDNKFKEIKGKVVEWTLTVYEVAKNGDDYKVQTLPGNEVGAFVYITPLNDEDKAAIEALKTGSQISIKGIIEDTFLRNLVIKPAILFQPSSAKSTPIEAQEPMPVTQPSQTQATSILGMWNGSLEGGNGEMLIKPAPQQSPDIFDVSLEVSGPTGCGGSFHETGYLSEYGAGLSVRYLKLFYVEDDGEKCVIDIKFAGDFADISEDNCSRFHGAACDFSGRLKKIQ